MASASASFTINGGATPQTTTPGATVTLALVSTTGVGVVEWFISGGSDKNKTKPAIVLGGSPLGATATFIMNTPVTAGLSWIVLCRINAGVASDGKTAVAAYTSTGLVSVPNSQSIMPFAFGETLERDPLYGMATDLNIAIQTASGGGGSPTGSAGGDLGGTYPNPTVPPTYSGTAQTTSATTTVLQTIALSADTVYRIYANVVARDTGGNFAEWDTSTRWGRASGGAGQIGGDNGPSPSNAGPITSLAAIWVTVTPSGNNVVLSVVTTSSSHTRFDWDIYVASHSLPAAV